MKLFVILLSVLMSLNVGANEKNPPGALLESLQGPWNMSCQAAKKSDAVYGIVPSWYEASKQINFFIDKTEDGNIFLNVKNQMPLVSGILFRTLPVFYTVSYRTSIHTFSHSRLASTEIENEIHLCDLEQQFRPDVASAFACAFQQWRNAEVLKRITLVDAKNAVLEVKSHFRDSEEENTIECALTR